MQTTRRWTAEEIALGERLRAKLEDESTGMGPVIGGTAYAMIVVFTVSFFIPLAF